MKNKKIYHINFSRTIDLVVWEYTIMNETERTNLTQLQFETSFDYEDNLGFYNMIVISDSNEMSKYIKILENNMIFHHHRDISNTILKNQYDVERIRERVKPSLMKIYESFMQKIDNWVIDNTDLDTVLDLINENGIENLRDADKKFLENYANK
jgi:hypothetical protein